MVTVGRWMSEREYLAMKRTGLVQQSPNGGAKGVLYPSDPTMFKNARAGDLYVEFDVPKSTLEGKSAGQRAISGPDSLRGRLANSKGLPLPELPPATNIRVIMKK